MRLQVDDRFIGPRLALRLAHGDAPVVERPARLGLEGRAFGISKAVADPKSFLFSAINTATI